MAIDVDGCVHPVDHEIHLPDGSVLRRAMLRSAGAVARVSKPFPRVGQGIAWLGSLAAQTSWVRGPVHELFPSVRVADAGSIDELVVLGRTDDVARRIAACSGFEWARDRAAFEHALDASVLDTLDRTDALERDILERAFERMPVGVFA